MKITAHPVVDKQTQILDLLKYGTVMVFVDSRRGGVVVPDYLKNDYQLRLNFDYAFEISDFRVLPDRIEASLSFNRKNFFCVIPFEAVYLVLNHAIRRGSLFVESVPAEMLEVFAAAPKDEELPPERMRAAGPTPQAASPPPDESQPSVPPPAPRRRGHLRVIK